MSNVELLSPAGTLKSMEYALAYGADAVYAGAPRYSLRVRNNDFMGDNIGIGIDRAHALGKKFFLTANVIPHNNKIKTFINDLGPILEHKPDALIMADPGLIMMVKEAYPETEIHLSVQANTINYASAKFWHSVGISRVILSRELSIAEVSEIKQHCPDLEIEVFVHGALCIAYSGRCLLSGYFNHRDPNQGTCTNACRWQYKTVEGKENSEGVNVPKVDYSKPENRANAGKATINIPVTHHAQNTAQNSSSQPGSDQGVYFLEEASRPGESMEISEDEHGTYILNSKDLRAIEHVHALIEAGVDCLKIEGRTKSHYYVARTAQLYRQAIDDAKAGKAFDDTLIGKLENLANRGYTDGFFQRHHSKDYQNYLENAAKSFNQQFVGEVISYDNKTGLTDVEVKNKITVGDTVEVIRPTGNKDMVIETMLDKRSNPITVAPGSGHIIKLDLGAFDSLTLLARYN